MPVGWNFIRDGIFSLDGFFGPEKHMEFGFNSQRYQESAFKR
jgi:hypothetical protein